MKPGGLTELVNLLEINFQKQQQKYSRVLAHEARIRGQIDKLDEQASIAQLQNTHQIQAIGAEVIWKAWLDRTKRSLNMELASVLVQKESLRSAVQKEYGKLLASKEMKERVQNNAEETTRRQNLEKWIGAHLQKPMR